ncbi:MAG: DUF4915 domain-containing protein, partial [Bacteroidota bacterium]
ITLLITREYENLVVALSTSKKKLVQSYMHLPHPSGLAVDRSTDSVYIAATRNPNQIIQLKPIGKNFQRKENNIKTSTKENHLIPCRNKYYCGAYYFHDLAMIGKQLYANAVGMNGIIKINLDKPDSEELCWWPKSMENKSRKPKSEANYIQLNSIAAGKTLKDSYFSASSNSISNKRPGDLDYPVDKQGVIFSGKTRTPIAKGLTRPHSARIIKNKVWVDNSGYGEVGYIEKGEFVPVIKFPGWTRGLCCVNNILFVGVSRIFPKFKHYAPGVAKANDYCSIYEVDIRNNKILGSIAWPYGNQIFAIDWMKKSTSGGFLFKKMQPVTIKEKNSIYSFKIQK